MNIVFMIHTCIISLYNLYDCIMYIVYGIRLQYVYVVYYHANHHFRVIWKLH
jgi:hypothetical protein